MASQSKKPVETWGSRLSSAVKDAVLDLIIDGRNYSSSQILAKLKAQDDEYMKDNGGNRLFKKLPSLRTIDRGVKAFRPRVSGEEWRVDDEKDPQDARVILDVYGAIIFKHIEDGDDPYVGGLSNQWAEWILCASKLAPGLQPLATFLLARLLLINDIGGEDSTPLEVMLAMAPWRSRDAYYAYYEAVESEKLPPVPQGETFIGIIGRDLHPDAPPFDPLNEPYTKEPDTEGQPEVTE